MNTVTAPPHSWSPAWYHSCDVPYVDDNMCNGNAWEPANIIEEHSKSMRTKIEPIRQSEHIRESVSTDEYMSLNHWNWTSTDEY